MTEKRKNAIVEFQDVVKTYGEALQYAVNHVSFSVEEGEFVVILGQSGTRKSTVLNMLGGMDQPTEGRVLIDGVEAIERNNKKCRIYAA